MIGQLLSRGPTVAPAIRQFAPTVVRVPLAIAQFVALALIARTSGEIAFGLLVFTQTATRLATAVSIRGGGPVMLQLFANDSSTSSRDVLRREVRTSMRFVLPQGIVLGLAVYLLFGLDRYEGVTLGVLLVLLLVAGNATRLASEAVKGMGFPTTSLVGEFLPQPLLFVGAAIVGLPTGLRGGLVLLALLIIAQLLSAAGLLGVVHRSAADDSAEASTTVVSSARFHLSISTVLTLSLPLLALGIAATLGDGVSVGRLSACLRLLAPATILISGVSAALLPRVARRCESTSALRASWLLVAVLSLPYSLVLLVAPNIVETIYGAQFAGLENVVRIVAIGQLVNGATGIAVEALQVTGRAELETRSLARAIGLALLAVLVVGVVAEPAAVVLGALFFAVVIASRSLAAGVHVYGPLVVAAAGERNSIS